MEKLRIPELVEKAWEELIPLPSVKDQGLREVRRKFLIETINKGRPSDLSVLPIQQLRDYARNNRLNIDQTATKKQLVTAIEEGLKPKSIRSPKKLILGVHLGTNQNLYFAILLKTRISHVFKIYLLSSVLRKEIMKEGFWRTRLRMEGFIEPKFKVRSWREWYLEVTGYPIPGDVYGKGENQYGRLGVISRKSNIETPTVVAPLSSKFINSTGYGIIDCDIGGFYYRGMSVFIDSFGKAYGAGKGDKNYTENDYGWNPTDPIAKKLLKKSQRAPPQPLYKVGKVEHAQIAQSLIFFQIESSIKCLDLTRTMVHDRLRGREQQQSDTYGEYFSILPEYLEGHVAYFVINETGDIPSDRRLVVLDDQGGVHSSKIEWVGNKLKLEFKRMIFTKLEMINGELKTIEAKPRTVVRLNTTRRKDSPLRIAIITTDNKALYYLDNEGRLIEDTSDVFSYQGYRDHRTYFSLQIGHPYHMKGFNGLHAVLDRIISFVPNPKIDM